MSSSMQTAHDVPLLISSENAGAEKRCSPSWTLAQFKTKLEPVTGVPPSAQRLSLKLPGKDAIPLEAIDEESTTLSSFALQPYAEITVTDLRPPSARPNLHDPSSIPKYEMPPDQYATLNDSVLAWKQRNKLGRFDPSAPTLESQRLAALHALVEERGIKAGVRCRLGGETDGRRGEVAYVGEVEEIPGPKGTVWVGVKLDEPVGKNDGSVKEGGKRYFDAGGAKRGVFVKPEKVEVGDWPVLDELAEMEEM